MITEHEGTYWKEFFRFLKLNQRFFVFLGILLVGELILTLILPSLFPETWYLRSYLPWISIKKTQEFLKGDLNIELDEKLGWRNKPNTVLGEIKYDQFGSRSAKGISLNDRSKCLVSFMGDSRIGGYRNIPNEQTSNAYLENEKIETLNLATNLYGLDQVFIAMKDVIKQFEPDYIVIGVGSDVGEPLNSHYLPFLHSEVGEPLLKPRFVLENDQLILKTPNFKKFLDRIPDSIELLAYLKLNDAHYSRFNQFKANEFTPILGLLSIIQTRIGWYLNNLRHILGIKEKREVKNIELVKKLLQEIHNYSKEWGVTIIFLLMPKREEFLGNVELKAYQQIANLLKSKGFAYVDVLTLFKTKNVQTELFFDRVHNTGFANKIIAQELLKFIQ